MSAFKTTYSVLAIAALLQWVVACSGPEHPAGHEEAEAHEEHGEHSHVELTPEAASRVEIRTAPVEERVLTAEMETTGQVDFDETRLAHVSPRITGRVDRVRALLGQEVRKGDTLAEIDSIELGRAKAEFLQAKAKQELARRSFEREQELFADRIASEQEVLVAEAEFREATAALLTADETLHLYGLSQDQVDALRYDDPKTSVYPLRAPFAGTIVEKHATLGELVTPENNLFTLADLSRVWIWIDVYEKDLGQVHLDDEVQAHVEAYPGEAFRGVVSYLSAQVDVDTRTARARLDVANPDRRLRPGMFARVRLSDPHDGEGSATLGKSLVVASAAVQRDGDEFIVFAVDGAGTGRFERREVLTGRKTGDFVEVLSGLRAGEEVVVEGAFLLKSEASKETMGEGHTH